MASLYRYVLVRTLSFHLGNSSPFLVVLGSNQSSPICSSMYLSFLEHRWTSVPNEVSWGPYSPALALPFYLQEIPLLIYPQIAFACFPGASGWWRSVILRAARFSLRHNRRPVKHSSVFTLCSCYRSRGTPISQPSQRSRKHSLNAIRDFKLALKY